jgi:hypothetical protein
MPQVNQYMFTHKELLVMLIKQAGLHDGKWMIAANLGFSPGNFGPSPDQMSPGAIMAILQIGIQRAMEETPDQMILDAAVVNPPTQTSKKKG